MFGSGCQHILSLSDHSSPHDTLVEMIVNLTPHDVVVFYHNGKVTFPRSGRVLRVTTEKRQLVSSLGLLLKEEEDAVMMDKLHRVPVYSAPAHKGLDIKVDPEENVIVSLLVVDQLLRSGHKGMIFTPDTSPDSVVRDDKGAILGVTALQWHNPPLVQ